MTITKKTPEKCLHCGKEKGNHHAITLNCPGGLKHRVMGYTRFIEAQVFEPRTSRKSKAKDKLERKMCAKGM